MLASTNRRFKEIVQSVEFSGIRNIKLMQVDRLYSLSRSIGAGWFRNVHTIHLKTAEWGPGGNHFIEPSLIQVTNNFFSFFSFAGAK